MTNKGPVSTRCTFNNTEVDCDWYTCFELQKDKNWPHLEYIFIPSGMYFYSGGSVAKQNLEYPLTEGWYNPDQKMTHSEIALIQSEAERDPVNADTLSRRFAGEIDLSFFGSYALAQKYSQMSSGCGVNCIASYVVRNNDQGGIKVINMFSPWNLLIFLGLDPEDIGKSLRSEKGRTVNPFGLSREEKIYLLSAYGIKEDEIKNKIQNTNGHMVFTDPIRKSLRNDPAYVKLGHPYMEGRVRYFILKRIRRVTQKMGYGGCMYPLVFSPDNKPAHPELILFDCRKTLGRNVFDSLDWQYAYANVNDTAIGNFKASETNRLILHLRQYRTIHLDFHSGTLYAHSVWTALYLQEMFEQMRKFMRGNTTYKSLADSQRKDRLLIYEARFKGDGISEILRKEYDDINKRIEALLIGRGSRMVKWSDGLPDHYIDILPIAGFFHDIGKAGDNKPVYFHKPDHTKRGAKYITKQLSMVINNEPDINIDLLLDELGIDSREIESNYQRCLLICSSSLHWDFGSTLKELSKTRDVTDKLLLIHNYIVNVIKCVYKTGIRLKGSKGMETFREIFLSIMLISIADVMATQPFVDYSIFDENRDKLETLGCWKNNHAASYKDDHCHDIKNLNAFVEKYPFLANYPKSQRGGRKFVDFRTNTLGYRFMRLILYEYDNRIDYYQAMKTIGLITYN
jgi:hypothetical protein